MAPPQIRVGSGGVALWTRDDIVLLIRLFQNDDAARALLKEAGVEHSLGLIRESLKMARDMLSLNKVVPTGDGDEDEFGAVIPDRSLQPEDELLKVDSFDTVTRLFKDAGLTELEAQAVIGRVFDEESFETMAAKTGVARSRAFAIWRKAVRKLRAHLEEQQKAALTPVL